MFRALPMRSSITCWHCPGTKKSAPSTWSLARPTTVSSTTFADATSAVRRCSRPFEARSPVDEGSVGAGTGTIAFGWKGGIGTSSRKVAGGWTVGVLVQSNFGGTLTIDGAPVGRALDKGDGSIMIVIATDAPVDARNLKRMDARAMLGLAST